MKSKDGWMETWRMRGRKRERKREGGSEEVQRKRFSRSPPTFRIALVVMIAAFSIFKSMSTAACAALGDFTSMANTL